MKIKLCIPDKPSKLRSAGIRAVALGKVYKIPYADKSFEGGLGLLELRCINVGFYWTTSRTTNTLLGGSVNTSTSIVKFGKRIKARGILGYRNSSQNNSPFKGD